MELALRKASLTCCAAAVPYELSADRSKSRAKPRDPAAATVIMNLSFQIKRLSVGEDELVVDC